MHHIHHTSGFVLAGDAVGEASRVFKIFTKDLGFITASAQGVRLLKSKLRYNIDNFTFCDLSAVRGKEFWRLTGAAQRINLYEEFHHDPEILTIFLRVFSLLERLLSGEEKNQNLWDCLEQAVLFAQTKNLTAKLALNFECVLVLRALHTLGYLGISPDTEPFIKSPYFTLDLLIKMNSHIPRVLGEINQSLKESQL